VHFQNRLVPSATSLTAGSSEVAAAIAVVMALPDEYFAVLLQRRDNTAPQGVPVCLGRLKSCMIDFRGTFQ